MGWDSWDLKLVGTTSAGVGMPGLPPIPGTTQTPNLVSSLVGGANMPVSGAETSEELSSYLQAALARRESNSSGTGTGGAPTTTGGTGTGVTPTTTGDAGTGSTDLAKYLAALEATTGQVNALTEQVKLQGEQNKALQEQIAAYLAAMKSAGAGSGTSGAMDYADYLKNYGSDTQKIYGESIRAANDDYYRALMTYGKNAEALAGNGLSGSGVSDYGGQAAWAARQGAVAAAGTAKQEADAENARSYSEYLQNYKAQQEAAAQQANAARANALSTVMSLAITDPTTAQQYLAGTNYFTDEEAASFGNTFAGYNAGVVEQTKTATDVANVGAALNAFNNMIAGGSTQAQAEAYIRTTYGDTIADEVIQSVNSGDIDSMDRILKAAEVPTSGYNPLAEGNQVSVAFLDQIKAATGMDDETYNAYLSRIQALNEKWIMGVLEDAHDEYNFKDACAALGITVENEDDAVTYGEAAVETLRDAVFEMVKAGEISVETASRYLEQDFLYEYDATIETGGGATVKNIVASLLDYKGYAERIGDGALYGDLLQSVEEKCTLEARGGNHLAIVSENGAEILLYFSAKYNGERPDSVVTKLGIKGNGRYSMTYGVDKAGTLWVKNDGSDSWRKVDVASIKGEFGAGTTADQNVILGELVDALVRGSVYADSPMVRK